MSKQTLGESLRSAREAIPASLYQAARETKIRLDFLEAMEDNNFRFLSGGTYIRGMLRAYGKWLRLDEEQLVADFDEIYGSPGALSVRRIITEPAQVAPRPQRPKWMIAAVLAAGTLLVLSLVGVMNPVAKVASPPEAPVEQALPSAPSAPAGQVAQAPASQSVQLTVSITGVKSWVRVVADGSTTPAFEGTLFNGNARSFDARDELRVTIGNLGAVRITLNGKDLGAAGNNNEARTLVFTRASTGFGRG